VVLLWEVKHILVNALQLYGVKCHFCHLLAEFWLSEVGFSQLMRSHTDATHSTGEMVDGAGAQVRVFHFAVGLVPLFGKVNQLVGVVCDLGHGFINLEHGVRNNALVE
jgi:hypothetical protein